jgi:mannose-6-phosphate isomerase-like protein (cupin superfamily)
MPSVDDVIEYASVDETPDYTDEQLPPNQIIHMDDLPWLGFIDPRTNVANPHVFAKVLMPADPRTEYSASLIWHAPGFGSSPHWHKSDTLYIVMSGELHVKGEGVYRPGDYRWVRGGTAYDAEQAGDEPLETLLISFGPGGRFDADVTPAPNGDFRKKKK